ARPPTTAAGTASPPEARARPPYSAVAFIALVYVAGFFAASLSLVPAVPITLVAAPAPRVARNWAARPGSFQSLARVALPSFHFCFISPAPPAIWRPIGR